MSVVFPFIVQLRYLPQLHLFLLFQEWVRDLFAAVEGCDRDE